MRQINTAYIPRKMRPLAAELAALPMMPLLVRCTVPRGYLPADPDGGVHLDSLLGAATLAAFPSPVWWPDERAAIIPVPLAPLWVSPGGLPLWAATPLLPHGAVERIQGHWHKRYPVDRTGWMRRQSANLSAGRYKEYRVPVTTYLADELTALCLGHGPTVAALLAQITHVGKKGAAGYGRVASWAVEAATGLDEAEARATILAGRAVPVACLRERGAPIDPALVRVAGWTPPYWYRPWHDPVCAAVAA